MTITVIGQRQKLTAVKIFRERKYPDLRYSVFC